jgi:hypothetical protein
MVPPTTDWEDLHRRLNRIEKQNRILKGLATCAVAVVGVHRSEQICSTRSRWKRTGGSGNGRGCSHAPAFRFRGKTTDC